MNKEGKMLKKSTQQTSKELTPEIEKNTKKKWATG